MKVKYFTVCSLNPSLLLSLWRCLIVSLTHSRNVLWRHFNTQRVIPPPKKSLRAFTVCYCDCSGHLSLNSGLVYFCVRAVVLCIFSTCGDLGYWFIHASWLNDSKLFTHLGQPVAAHLQAFALIRNLCVRFAALFCVKHYSRVYNVITDQN